MWVWIVLAFLAGAVMGPVMFAAVMIGRVVRVVRNWEGEPDE